MLMGSKLRNNLQHRIKHIAIENDGTQIMYRLYNILRRVAQYAGK